MTCPICQDTDTFLAFRIPDRVGLIPGLFNIMECRRCGGQYLDPMPDKDFVDPYYDIYWNEDSAPRSLATAGEAAYKKFLNWTELIHLKKVAAPGSKILDVGCGAGDALQFLHRWGYDCSGLESSDAGVKATRARVPCEVHQGTLFEHPFAPHSFDLILMSHVLEHMYEPERALKEIHQLLKPGGRLCLMVPSIDSLQRMLFKEKWFIYYPPRHVLFFSPKSLGMLLSRCGFNVETVRHVTLKHASPIFIISMLPRLDPYYMRRTKGFVGIAMRLFYLFLSVALMPLTILEGLLRKSPTIMVIAKAHE